MWGEEGSGDSRTTGSMHRMGKTMILRKNGRARAGMTGRGGERVPVVTALEAIEHTGDEGGHDWWVGE